MEKAFQKKKFCQPQLFICNDINHLWFRDNKMTLIYTCHSFVLCLMIHLDSVQSTRAERWYDEFLAIGDLLLEIQKNGFVLNKFVVITGFPSLSTVHLKARTDLAWVPRVFFDVHNLKLLIFTKFMIKNRARAYVQIRAFFYATTKANVQYTFDLQHLSLRKEQGFF